MGTRTSQAVVENIRWVERHSVELRSLAETDVLRKVLAQFGQRLDGELAAASTVSRKRATLFNVVGYAVEKTDYFEVDPLLTISWTTPPNTVDRRRVVNEANGRLLRLHLREFGTALDGRLFQARRERRTSRQQHLPAHLDGSP